MKRFLPALCLLLLLPTAHADVRKLGLRDLCSGATRIVVGQVTDLRPQWQGSLIVTRVHIAPEKNLKGTGSGPLVFTIPGGTVGETTLHVGEAPRFRVGERVVVFLRAGVSRCDVYGWWRGKLTVVNGRITEMRGTSLAVLEVAIQRYVGKKREGK